VKEKIFELAHEFSAETHGSSSYDKDPIFVMGQNENEFVPLSYVQKKKNLLKVNHLFLSRALFIALLIYLIWANLKLGLKTSLVRSLH
jgi:hypothetical protein